MAEQALEVGLSNNFELRNHPVNSLVRARNLTQELSVDRAVDLLSHILDSPDGPSKRGISKGRCQSEPNYNEFWAAFFLELIAAHRKLGQTVRYLKHYTTCATDFIK